MTIHNNVKVVITCFVGLDYDWVTWLTDTSSSECMYDDGVVCEWIQVHQLSSSS